MLDLSHRRSGPGTGDPGLRSPAALVSARCRLRAGRSVCGHRLFELSRRREQGLDISWEDAFDVLHSPSRDAIAALGFLLLGIFAIWIGVAQAIHAANFGYEPAASIPHFIRQVFTTPAGWMLIVVGNFVGFLFAVTVLTISVVAFPLLVDREVGAVEAVLTSARAVAANP